MSLGIHHITTTRKASVRNPKFREAGQPYWVDRTVSVRLAIDLDAIADEAAARVASNKSRKAELLSGKVKAELISVAA